VKTVLKLLVGLVVAGGLMALFLRGVKLEDLVGSLRAAEWPWLVVCLVFTLLHYLVRAWRWRYLLWPLRPDIPIRPLLEAILAGYAVTFLLPGRLGEVVRPALLSRGQRLPLAGTMATVGLDRLLDGAALTFFLMIFLVMAPGAGSGMSAEVVDSMRFWGILVGGGMVLALIVLGVLSYYRRLLPEAVSGGGWKSRLLGMVRSALDGMTALHGGRPLAGAVVGSLLIWLVIAVQAWTGLLAFGIDLPFTAAFGLISALAVGIAVPTPGGVGGYHAAGGGFLVLVYGVNQSQATAAILVLHLISVVPTIILGGLVMVREGISIGELLGRAGGPAAAAPVEDGT
jgi:uncharacterized protein (TIRG00374 family)